MWKKQGEVDHEDDPGIHGVGQFVLMKLYISLLINSKSVCIVILGNCKGDKAGHL